MYKRQVPGRCYKIIGVGAPSVTDLDLKLYAPANPDGTPSALVDQDVAEDNYPVIGLARPLCIPPGMPPISAQLRIRAYSGSGNIGIQMFATPFNGQMQSAPMMAQPGMVVGQPGVVYAPR